MKTTYSRQFSEEIKQKKAITRNLINKILYSKRLLVDHVESLEQCMLHTQNTTTNIEQINATKTNHFSKLKQLCAQELFTGRHVCALLGSTILQHLITPKSLRLSLLPSALLTGSVGAVYVVKNIFVFRNKIVERELDKLIHTIDQFGNCIRRNMTYFNEIVIMKQAELIESRQIERAWDCITTAKEVTEILYDATRKLETQYLIPMQFLQYYSPMEELRECEYFKTNVTDYSPKHIKDFHNIFAYVQSQFLLRLALTILTKPSISMLNADLNKINCLVRQLVLEEDNHFQNLTIELNKKKQMEIEALNTAKTMQNRSGSVAVLQDSSLKLSACMVAVAGECQALDITLQRLSDVDTQHKPNAKQLVQVANNMHSIENALSLCFDDFQRLMLVYNKFLHTLLASNEKEKENSDIKKDETADDEFPESFLCVEISQNHDVEKKDDFYAYIFDEQQAAAEQQHKQEKSSPLHDNEILNFDKRITKHKFRPVLKQLKDRIDPIRQVMLEKEREVLMAKGVNVDELFKKESSLPLDDVAESDDSSAGSADLEFERRSKKLKERDNFAEMRNFLAQKPPINLFKLESAEAVSSAVGTEEVLESEC